MSVSSPRPNKRDMKIAYKILKTPKQLQQSSKEVKIEHDKRLNRWYKESQYRNY